MNGMISTASRKFDGPINSVVAGYPLASLKDKTHKFMSA